jgi:RsiW-degrading membrane proteinase PrsW (M82 family)
MFGMSLTQQTLLPLSILAAALPALAYTMLIYWADRYEKEPAWLLAATFLWGAVPAALLALIANALFSLPLFVIFNPETAQAIAGVTIAPLVEETAKAIALFLIFFFWRQEIDSLLDGIIYGAMVGMGFAMVENIFYFYTGFLESGSEGWNALVLVRAILFGLNHALYTSMTGLGLAISRLSTDKLVRWLAPLLGWAAAVTFHAVHNLAVTVQLPGAYLVALLLDWGGVLLTAFIIFGALHQERRWMKTYLAEEVRLGTLSAEQYELCRSSLRRGRFRLGQLLTAGPAAYRRYGKLYQRYSELAYQKHHQTLFKDAKSAKAIVQLRTEIAGLAA